MRKKAGWEENLKYEKIKREIWCNNKNNSNSNVKKTRTITYGSVVLKWVNLCVQLSRTKKSIRNKHLIIHERFSTLQPTKNNILCADRSFKDKNEDDDVNITYTHFRHSFRTFFSVSLQYTYFEEAYTIAHFNVHFKRDSAPVVVSC